MSTTSASRAWRRALVLALIFIILSVVLSNGLGVSSTAKWARNKFNNLIPSFARVESPQNHEQQEITQSSDALDPCEDEPIVPYEVEPQNSNGTLVLITGGAGFIGSNLADRLISLGYRVRILDNLYTGFIRNVPLQEEGIEFIHGDILDAKILEKAIKDVEYVFHLAAMSKVLPSTRDPEMARFCTENNALGSWNVLNATRKQNIVKKVIYAGSSTYYGNRPIPHNEDNAPDFLTPYAASKYEGEIQMKMFDNLFNLPTITNRFFMVYGPRQPTTGAYAIVTGVFARQAAQGKPLTIEGDGSHFRDFIHVNDIVTGLILSQQNKELRGGIPVNLGSGVFFSVKDVADMISSNQIHVAERKNDLIGTLADTCRMKKLLKYKARTDFRKEMSFMAQETMKGNVFAQEWLTPLLALSVPYVLPADSPILPWAETHQDLEGLLSKIEFVKGSISQSQSDDNKLISVIPFGYTEQELDEQALLLANTVYSLVRFGKVRSYIVAALSEKHLEVCRDYNMPCFDASSIGIASLVQGLLNNEHYQYDVHVTTLGTVTVDAIYTAAVDGADITHLRPNGGLIIRSKSSTSEGNYKAESRSNEEAAESDDDEVSSVLKTLSEGKSLVIKSGQVDSLCTTEKNETTSSPSHICPKTPVLTLSCNQKQGFDYPGGMAGMIWSLRNAGLWQLSDCTDGKYCDKQQYVPLKWVQSPPDLSTDGRFCPK
jgi:nucleoside-diphosphate-sugar epimerase